MSSVILIPARLGSTRLPNKPLADINGKSMIQRVYIQARQSRIKDIIVCTDSQQIVDEIEMIHGQAILTPSELVCGTDRIHHVARNHGLKYDYIINLQGDMPNINPSYINKTLEILENQQNCHISTLVAKINNIEEVLNPNIVKAVLSIKQGAKYHKALYFTRCSAPANPKNIQNPDYFQHLGIYGYTRESLDKFVSYKESYLEKRESLEQLRALENDMNIYASVVDVAPISVDTADDLESARRVIVS